MCFLPKREQKGVVILLANNMIDMGEGLVSTLLGACWCVTSVQLRSFGLQCVQSLSLTPPPSVLMQNVRNSCPIFFVYFGLLSSLTPLFCHPAGKENQKIKDQK